MVRCENGLNTRPERPRPRGAKRFITMPLPTWASETIRSSTSRSWLFSALAIADSRHFLTSTDPLARKLQIGKRGPSLPAADQLLDKIKLLRDHPKRPGDC